MAGDLGQTGLGPGDDDDLVARDPGPDLGPDEPPRHRVADRAQPDRLIVADRAGLAEGRRVRLGRQAVEVAPLDREQIVGSPAGLAMDPPVDGRAEADAGGGQGGEARIGRQQVRLGRDEVGLGDLDRALAAALRLGVERGTGKDRRAIVAAGGDDLRVADRDPGDPLDGHRPLVVGEQVGRHPADLPEGRVETGEQAAHRPIPGRDDDPEPAPGEPGAEQERRPAIDHRSAAPVELEPHAGLGDPRTVRPPAAGPVRGLGQPDGPAGRPLRAVEAERSQPLVDDVGPDPPGRALDELLDLRAVRVDLHRPPDPGGRVVAPVTPVDVAGDGLRIAGGEVGRRMGAAGEIECFEDLHDLPVRLLHGPSGSGDDLGVGTPQGSPGRGDRDGRDWMARGDQLSADREISCPSARKSVSAYREVGMSVFTRGLPGLLERRRTASSPAQAWIVPDRHPKRPVSADIRAYQPRRTSCGSAPSPRPRPRPGRGADHGQIAARGLQGILRCRRTAVFEHSEAWIVPTATRIGPFRAGVRAYQSSGRISGQVRGPVRPPRRPGPGRRPPQPLPLSTAAPPARRHRRPGSGP